MTFLEKLDDFMRRTIAFGMSDGALDLAKTAQAEGLVNVASVLRNYAASVSTRDIVKASAYFSMLHIFFQG